MGQSSCKSSSAWFVPILRPLSTDSSSFPTRVPGTPCSPRRISMGEETKARGIAEGSATTEKIEKKKEPKWRHTFSVFSGHPPALLANSFFRRRPSPSYPSILLSFSHPAGLPRLLFPFSGYSRAIRTLAQPTSLLFPYSFSILQAHPVPPGHLLVRPRYFYILKSKKGEKNIKKEKKEGHAGVPTKCEIRVCQNGEGGGDFH